MKFTRALLALSLTLIIACSLAASIQRQKEADAVLNHSTWTDVLCPYSSLASPTGYSITAAFAEKAPLPVNATRTSIFNFVSANPGVQFRAICSSLGLSIGVVQFHLAVLQKAGLVVSIRKGFGFCLIVRSFTDSVKNRHPQSNVKGIEDHEIHSRFTCAFSDSHHSLLLSCFNPETERSRRSPEPQHMDGRALP